MFSTNAAFLKLLFSCKLSWKLLYSLKHFKCIALRIISISSTVFVGYDYIKIWEFSNI